MAKIQKILQKFLDPDAVQNLMVTSEDTFVIKCSWSSDQ